MRKWLLRRRTTRSGFRSWSLAALAVLILASGVSGADAANECRVEYGWQTSTGSNRSATINLNAGQTRTLNRDLMRYVRNRKNAPVDIKITNVLGIPPAATVAGTKTVALQTSTARDPASGSYFTDPKTKLYTIKCNASTSSAGATGSAPAVSAADAQKIANFVKALGKRAKDKFLKLPVTKQISVAAACTSQACLNGVAALGSQGTAFARKVLACLKSSSCKSHVVTVGGSTISRAARIALIDMPTGVWSYVQGKSFKAVKTRLEQAKDAGQLPASFTVTATIVALVIIIVAMVGVAVAAAPVIAVVAVATMVAIVGISTAITIVSLFT